MTLQITIPSGGRTSEDVVTSQGINEKKNEISEYCKLNKIFKANNSRKGQQENIIIRLEDSLYNAILYLAHEDKMTVENYAEKILQYFK